MNKNQYHEYGFGKGHSTINAVSKFTYDSVHAMDLGNYKSIICFSGPLQGF